MSLRLIHALLLAAAPVALAPSASASDLDLGLGLRIGHRSSLRVSIGNRAPRYGRPCPPQRVWVPGHYETVCDRVWVPGAWTKVWVEPVYQTRYDSCGRPVRVCVRDGYWRKVQQPGCYRTVERQVWVPGRYQLRY